MIKNIGIYLLIINIITFITYGVDKFKAKRKYWRIPEKTLIGLATLGGFLGALGGMYMFRHKTKHFKFVFGIPAIAIIWILVTIFVFTKMK